MRACLLAGVFGKSKVLYWALERNVVGTVSQLVGARSPFWWNSTLGPFLEVCCASRIVIKLRPIVYDVQFFCISS